MMFTIVIYNRHIYLAFFLHDDDVISTCYNEGDIFVFDPSIKSYSDIIRSRI